MSQVVGITFEDKLYESSRTLVYRGNRELTGESVVVKILKREYPPPLEMAQFQVEHAIMQKLRADTVIKAYELIRLGHTLALVLEDVGGESLTRLNTAYARKPNLTETLRILLRVTEALGEVHRQGVIHRDINPSNIVWAPDTDRVRLIDFGSAASLPRETDVAKDMGHLLGTIAYVSPEQTGRMNRTVDCRSDFYSLGVTLYELLTGQLPFSTNDGVELVHSHIAREPIAPHVLNDTIARPLSDIVLKLMSKNAEDRYQSTQVLWRDLQWCLHQHETKGRIGTFNIAQGDTSDRLQPPQRLYGREKEVGALLAAFERVGGGSIEMVLISGYSGIGKTSLVNEICKPVVRKHGFFIVGKSDQNKRSAPYGSLRQALSGLIQQTLTESAERVAQWKKCILEAVGSNAQVIIDVVPELEMIIGAQAPVPELSPAEAQNRFNLTFQRFVCTFARQEHPLVMFIDDLQWVDPPSLGLLKLFVTDPHMKHLLILGAYRNNEVDDAHPLTLMLCELRANARAMVQTVNLGPLNAENITALFVDTLGCTGEQVEPLVRLCGEKTGGNPFFLVQLMQHLHAEGLIAFHEQRRAWVWDIERIREVAVTDNVVDLMTLKIQHLPHACQSVLPLAACVGVRFDLKTLALAAAMPADKAGSDLWDALEVGLVVPVDESYRYVGLDGLSGLVEGAEYRFLHDRVQQAAYALLNEQQRKTAHLTIGRQLLENTPPKQSDERLLDVVNHMNAGADLLTTQTQRDVVARLNLRSARKAKASAAYEPALRYVDVGLTLLGDDPWTRTYELTYDLHKEKAEVEYLNMNFDRSQQVIAFTLQCARCATDKAALLNILLVQQTMRARYTDAVATGREALHCLGVELPQEDLPVAIEEEMQAVACLLKGRRIPSLVEQPEMTSPELRLAVQIMNSMGPLAYLFDLPLWTIITLKTLHLSLQHGPVPGESASYAGYGLILRTLERYEEAYDFGRLAIDLADRFGNISTKGILLLLFTNYIACWRNHLAQGDPLNDMAYQLSLQFGQLRDAGYALYYKLLNPYHHGANLARLVEEGSQYIAFCTQSKNISVTDMITGILLPVLNLTGETEDKFEFSYDGRTEVDLLDLWQTQGSFAGIASFKVFKAQVLYLYGEYEDALQASEQAREFLPFVPGHFVLCEHNFYHSLILAALYCDASPADQKKYLDDINKNQEQMHIWVNHCAENCLFRSLLVEAELARLQGNALEAIRHYDEAVDSARQHRFVHVEALASEVAARFWLAQGNERIARAYLAGAYLAYGLWGAKRKVDDLQERYPQLLLEATSSQVTLPVLDAVRQSPTSAESTAGVLDLSSLIKASQALSSELPQEGFLERMMNVAMESAGAQKGFLVLQEQGRLVVALEATAGGPSIEVLPSVGVDDVRDDNGMTMFPCGIMNYVARTREAVVLDDTSGDGPFEVDLHLRQRAASILCMPLVARSDLIGLLHLENDLAHGAFSRRRMHMFELLSSQMAIAIQNVRMYQDIEQSEQRYRMLVERMGEGVGILDSQRRIKYFNPALCNMLGYDLAEVLGRPVTTLLDATNRRALEIGFKRRKNHEGWKPYDLVWTRKDGEKVVTHMKPQPIYEQNGQFSGSFAVVTDLTERRRAEKEKAAMHAQLVQAQKLDAVGRLVGGVAHDFNNLLTVVIGCTDLLLLESDADDRRRENMESVLAAAYKAAALTRQLLAFSRAEVLVLKEVDLNAVVQSAKQMLSRLISEENQLTTDLAPCLKQVKGDVGRIEQLIMNLVINAQDAMPKGGTITLTTEQVVVNEARARLSPYARAGDYACLTVSDTGIGIERGQLDAIFEPFYTTKAVGEGTGLGLSVVYGIVKHHEGWIEVESEVGRGSVFKVYLPVIAELEQASDAAAGVSASLDELRGQGQRLLVVEDDTEVLQYATDVLRNNGYNVVGTRDACEACKIFEQASGNFDALFSDVVLPSMSGLDLAEELLASKPGLRILLTSGYTGERARWQAIRERHFLFIHKPYDVYDLVKMVHDALALRGAPPHKR